CCQTALFLAKAVYTVYNPSTFRNLVPGVIFRSGFRVEIAYWYRARLPARWRPVRNSFIARSTMPESTQHKLDRVRRPRVQITYDVETGGAMKMVELPFVVGVFADLSGQPKEALKPLKERKFVPIDRDNFNDVMARSAPRLAMKVDNKLTGDPNSKLAVELNFKSLSDFDPAKVASQVGPLNELLMMRQKLVELLSKMEGNDKLESLLADVLSNTEKAMALAKQMGVSPDETPKSEDK